MSPIVHTSATVPRVIQAFRGKAPKDGTSWLTLSNMKTFITPDDAYRSAARTCRIHNSTFLVCLFPVPSRRVRGDSLRASHSLSPDRVTMNTNMINTFHVAERTIFDTPGSSYRCARRQSRTRQLV